MNPHSSIVELYRNLVDNTIIGLLLIAEDGIVFANNGFAAMSGFSIQELEDMSIRDILSNIHPADREFVSQNLRSHLFASESTMHYEFRGYRKDGSLRWMEIVVNRIQFQGSPAVQITCFDITQKKFAELNERQNRERYKRIFDMALVSIWEEDFTEIRRDISLLKAEGVTDYTAYLNDHPDYIREAAGKIQVLDVNEATLKLYETENKELLLGSLSEIYLPETKHIFREEILAIAENKSQLQFEINIRSLKGNTRHVLMNILLPLADETSAIGLVTMMDISERESLLESERRQRLLAKTQNEVILAVTSEIDLSMVLDRLLEQARKITPFSTANVSLLIQGHVKTVRHVGYERFGAEEFMENFTHSLGDLSTTTMAYNERKPVIMTDTMNDQQWISFPQTAWIRSYMIIPISFRGEVLSFLRLDSEHKGTFSEEDAINLIPLVQAASVAIHNARLHDKAVREIEERKIVEEQLKRSLHEKEVLIQEINHRVKNNLSMITSLIRLQNSSAKTNDTINALSDLQARIQSISLVHEKLYQSRDLSKISLKEYLSDILNNIIFSLFPEPKAVRFSLDVDDLSLDLKSSVPLGLIVSELTTNSLKHGFPSKEGGIISISMSEEATSYTLCYSDNGVGLPEEFNYKAGESSGLKLIDALVQQLEGDLDFTKNGKTEFIITFPKAS